MSSRILRYAAVGLVGTLAQYVLYIALKESGMEVLPASVLGYCVGAIVNYYLNFKVTFELRSTHGQAAPRFFAVALAGLALNAAVVFLLTRTTALHYVAVQMISTVLCFLFTYALNSIWSFRSVGKTPDQG